MPKTFDANLITEPPADLPLSTRVKGLRKAYGNAVQALSKFRKDYAKFRTIDVSEIWESKARYSSQALEEAKEELRSLELKATKEGKPLPDRDEFLGEILTKMEDYKRSVSAHQALIRQAKEAYSQGIYGELKEMGLKEARAAQKAREEYEKAYKAAMAARETLQRHAGLFTWCATAGGIEGLPLDGASAGNQAEAWELAEDGRLSMNAAIALGFEGVGVIDGLIVVPEPVIDEQAEADARFWQTYKPKMFIANPDGYGPNWDH